MRYQKFIVGDIIKDVEAERYFIVHKAGLTKYNLIRLQFPIDEIPEPDIQPQLTYEQYTEILEKNGYYELVYRIFPRTSDYHCRELCEVKTGCKEGCPLFVKPSIYFLGDEVTIKDSSGKNIYRTTVTGTKIPNLYYYTATNSSRRREYKYENIIIPSSSVTVKEAIERIENRKDELEIVYELRYPEDEKRLEYSITKKAEDIRLFHRRGYTLDPDIPKKIKIINGE